MTPAIYYRLDEAPEPPDGSALYRADCTTAVPDDDGGTHYSVWLIATHQADALAQAEAHVVEANEGGRVLLVEREELS